MKPGVPQRWRGRPAADWTIPQNWSAYTPAQHALWDQLYATQMRLLPGRVVPEFLAHLQQLFREPGIPRFERLNERLRAATGWQVVAVPGLVPDEVFFDHLANRRFPAGNFLRSPEQLDYLEEPDVFHDVFGHVPLLMNPVFADYMAAYGRGGLKAHRLGRLRNLSRLYWYTVEFGLIRHGGQLRIFGAGIASSRTESLFALDSVSPNRVGFDLERVMRTEYRIDDFQETYFVIESFQQLLELARIDFSALYARLADGREHPPGAVLAGDRVFAHGTGEYHAARRRSFTSAA